MMLTYDGFTLMMILTILAPVAGAITLLLMLVFEREFDLLTSQNTKLALENELRHMEYLQLNQQIQPHFLFNTLNLLLSLARLKKMPELVKSLEHLSLFFRFKYQVKEPLIPLAEEVKYTNNFLEIQKMRFGQRLKLSIDCPEELKDVLIMPYLLQTLVENAFKHGLEKKIGEAVLSIHFSEENDSVKLDVVDNGPGNPSVEAANESRQSSPGNGQGVQNGQGLLNIRRRLDLLYGSSGTLTLIHPNEGGTCVSVKWPLVYQGHSEVKA